MFIRHVVSFQSLSKLTKNVAKLIVFDATVYEKTEHGIITILFWYISIHYYKNASISIPNCPY